MPGNESHLVSFGIGFVAGFLAEYFASVVRDWRTAPRLTATYYGHSEEHAHEYKVAVTNANGVREIYVRLKIINMGHRVATNATGNLIKVELWDEKLGRFRDTGYRDSIPLCWSYRIPGNTQLLDLPTAVPKYLDIFSTRENSQVLEPRLTVMPLVYQDLFQRKTAKFRLSIAISADGATVKFVQITIDWHGEWERIEIEATESNNAPEFDWRRPL